MTVSHAIAYAFLTSLPMMVILATWRGMYVLHAFVPVTSAFGTVVAAIVFVLSCLLLWLISKRRQWH